MYVYAANIEYTIHCVRGHHVSKTFWLPRLREELPCEGESGNRTNPYAVASIERHCHCRTCTMKNSQQFVSMFCTKTEQFCVPLVEVGISQLIYREDVWRYLEN